MPVFAALIKVTNCRQFGANVVLHGADLTEARAHAGEIAARDGLTFIHPFDNADVIAGQGTMGLEILEQTPGRRGDRRAGRRRRPHRGHRHRRQGEARRRSRSSASSRSAPRASPRRSRRTRRRRSTLSHTLADGLAVGKLGDAPFAIVKRVVDRVVTVDEASIALAILRLIELEKSVVEGAGAAPLAAFLAGRLDALKGKRVVLVLCRRQHRFVRRWAASSRSASSPTGGCAGSP